MRKASKSSSKNLQVNIIKDTNLPPDLIRVNQKMVYKQSFKDKFGIIVESIGTANFQLIQDIPRVDNLYIEISDIYYKFDINKIDELFLVEESVSRNSFTGVILLVEREYYEFPYGNIKVRVGGSTEASSSSSSSSLSSSSSSSRIPESRNQNDIPDLQNKMIEGFLRNNGKQIGEYTVNGSTSGKINVIEPRLFNLTASFLKQPDITDPDLEFYVLNPSINKHISSNHNQVYTIYK